MQNHANPEITFVRQQIKRGKNPLFLCGTRGFRDSSQSVDRAHPRIELVPALGPFENRIQSFGPLPGTDARKLRKRAKRGSPNHFAIGGLFKLLDQKLFGFGHFRVIGRGIGTDGCLSPGARGLSFDVITRVFFRELLQRPPPPSRP